MMKMKNFLIATLAAAMLVACNSGTTYDATGLFEATTVTISAEASGKILSLDIEEGDTLAKHDLVGTIDTVALVLQRKQLQSQMASLESSRPDIARQIESLRQQIAQQRTECERVSNLLKDGAATRKQADDADALLKILTGQLEAMLSTLNKNTTSINENAMSVNYQIEQINDQINKCRIMAPIAGTVLTKYAEAKEYATTGRQLFRMANMNEVYLRAYFTSTQLSSLRLGQQVTVVADFGGDRQYEYPGEISWIAEESEFTPKSIQTNDSRADLVYAVKITVKNDGRLKLGMYGGVKL